MQLGEAELHESFSQVLARRQGLSKARQWNIGEPWMLMSMMNDILVGGTILYLSDEVRMLVL
jgi:hypothetical protein